MNSRFAIEIGFWISVAALGYIYAGYPVLIAIASRLFPRPVRKAAFEPKVSIVITAYNEERDLRRKLENTLALDYPTDKLEIIVASDCSSDGTERIAEEFGRSGVRLFRQTERLGKTAAQNGAVAIAAGDIVLFSDATTIYEPNVLKVLLPSFSDESVGCVAGRLVYVDPAESGVGRGARSYWSYETFLKQNESRINSLVGASGCLYAVRRSAYVPMYNEACSDFLIATTMVSQSLRAVFEPDAVCTEETNRRSNKELRMRVRVITQTLNDLWRHRSMMNPFSSGFYAVQLLSHKLFRYFVPFLLFVGFLTSVILSSHSILFTSIALVQAVFYLLAAAGFLLEISGFRLHLTALPFYFCLTNLASVVAVVQFLRGERYARWEPIRESASVAGSLKTAGGVTSLEGKS